jgi:hypothetical protein
MTKNGVYLDGWAGMAILLKNGRKLVELEANLLLCLVSRILVFQFFRTVPKNWNLFLFLEKFKLWPSQLNMCQKYS